MERTKVGFIFFTIFSIEFYDDYNYYTPIF